MLGLCQSRWERLISSGLASAVATEEPSERRARGGCPGDEGPREALVHQLNLVGAEVLGRELLTPAYGAQMLVIGVQPMETSTLVTGGLDRVLTAAPAVRAAGEPVVDGPTGEFLVERRQACHAALTEECVGRVDVGQARGVGLVVGEPAVGGGPGKGGAVDVVAVAVRPAVRVGAGGASRGGQRGFDLGEFAEDVGAELVFAAPVPGHCHGGRSSWTESDGATPRPARDVLSQRSWSSVMPLTCVDSVG